VNAVRKIGQVHARIGLELRWYIASCSFIAERVSVLITLHCHAKVYWRRPMWTLRSRSDAQLKAMVTRYNGAFFRAGMLDMDSAISIYLEEGELAKQKSVREIATAIESSFSGIVYTVAAAAELEQTARLMSSIAKATSSKAVVVSAAAEQATHSVSTVANSTDEVNHAVAETFRQVSHASRITASAVVKPRSTNEKMVQLSAAADKIGEVISLISDIADQANLLALNATIESACTGEAGRGFAVVAAQVKVLAGQTGKPTEEIGQQIVAMQEISRQSVAAIAENAGHDQRDRQRFLCDQCGGGAAIGKDTGKCPAARVRLRSEPATSSTTSQTCNTKPPRPAMR
jgi:hypothetical protein